MPLDPLLFTLSSSPVISSILHPPLTHRQSPFTTPSSNRNPRPSIPLTFPPQFDLPSVTDNLSFCPTADAPSCRPDSVIGRPLVSRPDPTGALPLPYRPDSPPLPFPFPVPTLFHGPTSLSLSPPLDMSQPPPIYLPWLGYAVLRFFFPPFVSLGFLSQRLTLSVTKLPFLLPFWSLQLHSFSTQPLLKYPNST